MTDPTPAAWRPCPSGEVTRLSAWLRMRRRVWTAAAVGGVAIALAGTVGTVWAVRSALLSHSTPPTKKNHKNKPITGGVDDGLPLDEKVHIRAKQ